MVMTERFLCGYFAYRAAGSQRTATSRAWRRCCGSGSMDPKVRFSEGRDMPPTRAHLDPTRPVINSSACVLSHRSQSLLFGFVTATARSVARTLATRQCCPMGAIHGPL